MNDDLLKLDSTKSLYPEITISIDGEKHACRPLVRSVMRKHYEWESNLAEASKAGDAQKVDDLIFEHLCFLFDVKPEVLDKFENDEIHALMNKLVIKIARRKVERTAELLRDEKKKEKPKEPEKKIPSRSTSKNSKKRGGNVSKK